MPRVTKPKTAAIPAVADKPLAKPSKTASTIPAKRAPDDSANKEGETASTILPNAKRVAFSDKSNLPGKANPEHEEPASTPQNPAACIAQNATPASGEAPDWAWDVCGRWEVRSSRSANYDILHRELDVPDEGKGPMYLTIRSSVSSTQKRQMWAEIEFGTLRGIIRFCPSSTEDSNQWPKDVPDFEKACEFSNCWPGSGPMGQTYWHTRRRGSNIRTGLNEKADDNLTDCTFSLDKDGRLTLETLLIFQSIIISIDGFKLDQAGPQPQDNRTPSEQWAHYKYDPNQIALPCADDGPWDITGKWRIDSSTLAEIFNVARPALDDNMSMEIHFTEDKKGKKLGRQLWATFKLGLFFEGIMRFCPYGAPQSSQQQSLAAFEKRCFLGEGDQVGKRTRGNPRWLMRWRGEYTQTDDKEDYSDIGVSSVTFAPLTGGGDIHIMGTFHHNGQTIAFMASKNDNSFGAKTKIQNPNSQPNPTQVHELWARHRSWDELERRHLIAEMDRESKNKQTA